MGQDHLSGNTGQDQNIKWRVIDIVLFSCLYSFFFSANSESFKYVDIWK